MRETTNTIPRRFLNPIDIDGLGLVAERADESMRRTRTLALHPESNKVAPTLSPAQVAALCQISIDQFNRRMAREEYPKGRMISARRHFTLGEARTWVRLEHPEWQRPRDVVLGQVLSVVQSKGGVGKTTTAVNTAHGISLRGLKVLLIDADSQGSATSLLHSDPHSVNADHTLLPLFAGEATTVDYAIQPTYWDGVDLIPAVGSLQGAEFSILGHILANSRERNQQLFPFWAMLDQALTEVRKKYDLIIIDTGPTLNQVNLNAIFAADGLLVPMPTAMLDYEASIGFWRLFSDITGQIKRLGHLDKKFEFIHVVPSMVDTNDGTTEIVLQLLQETYPDLMVPVQIPKTAAVRLGQMEFKSVYDITRYNGSRLTYRRAREAYDGLVEYVAGSIETVWRKRAELSGTPASETSSIKVAA